MQDSSDAGVERFFQYILRAEVINLVEMPAPPRPELRVGGQVVDLATATDGRPDGGAIADVGADQLDAFERQVIDPRAGSVEDAGRFAMLHQQMDEMTADEARATGDEDHDSSCSRTGTTVGGGSQRRRLRNSWASAWVIQAA